MSRLEKTQHQMNRSAIHGPDVGQELVDAQQAIYASLKALRAKTLEQEAKECSGACQGFETSAGHRLWDSPKGSQES